MSDVLATYLLREQLLKPDQVDDFLQLQVVLGGAFETHLLEAKLIEENALMRAMSEAYRMPPISREEIDDIPQKMPNIFPRVFAETYRMIPYRLIGRNLGVLVAEKPDETAVLKLEQRLKIRIMPAITSEPCVYYAMQRLYGADIPPRFFNLLASLDAGSAQGVPAQSAAAPRPDATHADSTGAAATNAIAPSDALFQRETPSLMPSRAQAMDLDTALARMQLAQNRNAVIDIVLEFANNAFKFSSLFVLQGNSFVGLRGKGDPTSASRVSRVTVPLIPQSMFKTVHDTHGHYLGAVPQVGMNATLLEDLGRETPKIVFLAPLIIRGKLTGLIYCDNGKRGVSSRLVADLLVVVTRMGLVFERLIQRKKAEVKVAANVMNEVVKKAATLKALASANKGEPEIASVAPALPEKTVIEDEVADAGVRSPELPRESSVGFEFKADEPTIAITFGDGQTLTPIAATDLVSQRFLEVFKATADEDEEEEHSGEESIDFSAVMAAAVLAKEEIKEPTHAPAKKRAKAEQIQAFKDALKSQDDGFKAFSSFANESDEDNTRSWQEVLIDTIAQGKQGGSSSGKAFREPESVEELGWEDIIVEAAALARGSADDHKRGLDDLSVLLEALDSPDEDVARRATENLWQRKDGLADTFGALLGQRFPGRLRVDPFHTPHLPPVVELSPVLRMLGAMGPQALHIVLPHLESKYPAHRLLATLFCGQVVSGHAFAMLLRRLFDEEPRIREAAADTLRKYARLPGYNDGVQRIREALQAPAIDAVARACEILGRLRDSKAIPLLIPLVGHNRPEIANTALGALIRISAQDWGHEPARWTEWWVRQSDNPREQWLIDALHCKEPSLRVIADEELRLLTGLNFSFDPAGDARAKVPAVNAWDAWWAHELNARR